VWGQSAADLAKHQPEAVEVAEVAPAYDPGDSVRDAASEIAERTVRSFVDRLRINERRARGKRCVQHPPDRRGVVLAILVHGDNPVGARARHAGQGRSVCAGVAREPDGPDVVVPASQGPDGEIRPVGTRVVDEDDLTDLEAVSSGWHLRTGVAIDLLKERPECVLPAVDRDHDRNRVVDECGRGLW